MKIDCTQCIKNKPYKFLKTGMVGGQVSPSVGTQRLENSRIHDHQSHNARTCASFVGFNVKSLYLYCSGHEMPCGKEKYIKVKCPKDPKVI